MWAFFNPNPRVNRAGDCAVRAIARTLDLSWEQAYCAIVCEGFIRGEMPSANSVWGSYLKRLGYIREMVPNTCPDCYTLAKFAEEHPKGRFVVALDGHVVAVCDGDYYDSWDSGDEVPLYYWRLKE